MIGKKTMFIIPGYRHSPANKAYQQLAVMLREEGYDPILVTIPWKGTTISENTETFLKAYRKIRTKKKYILGFSFGAMIAFLASTKVSVSGLILCSLSPYFQEDLSRETNNFRSKDFATLHFETLASQVKAEKILMLYGSKEARPLIKRVTNGFAQLTLADKALFPIKSVDHNIGDKRYLQTIHQVAKALN